MNLIAKAKEKASELIQDERGQALPEYGLAVALIAVFGIIALTALGLAISNKLQAAADAIDE